MKVLSIMWKEKEDSRHYCGDGTGRKKVTRPRPAPRQTNCPGLSKTVSALLNGRGRLEKQGRGRQGKVSEAGEEREEKTKPTERVAWGGLASTKKEMGTPRGLSITNKNSHYPSGMWALCLAKKHE